MGWAARRFLGPDPAAPAIDVRVVIPARDEAAVVAACVAACAGQATEVVVVDDGSSDGTTSVAAAAGATVVRLDGDPPAGWLGKPRACLAGAEGARTEWLAFVDADVVLAPAALATMAGATRKTSTSIVGGLECRSFWERLLLPELGLALTQEGFPPGFASGQCFLVRRDHYEAIGGHGHPSVRGSVVDDRDLALALGAHDADWSPFYRLVSRHRLRLSAVQHCFVLQCLVHVPPDHPLMLAVDATHFPRSSRRLPGVGWRKAPATAPFRPGL